MGATSTAPTDSALLQSPDGSSGPGVLSRCVGDVRTFLDKYWGRAPLYNEGADHGAFADLFSLDAVDRLVATSFARTPAFRLVRDGTPVPPGRYTKTARLGGQSVTGVGDPAKVFEELRTGATLVLQGLQRYWPPLARFCRDLELALTHPVQANAYVTPAGSRGLAVHYDTHDVFVLQVAGNKEWGVHDPVLVDPLPSQPWSAARGMPGPPFLSPKLRAGDILYVPRGFPHSAQAQEDLSVHLTIGVLTQTWHDVVKELVAATAEDPAFRQSLPVGFAHDEQALVPGARDIVQRLRRYLDEVAPEDVAAGAVKRFWSARPTHLEGQLQQLLLLDRLRDDSVVRRRPRSVCQIVPGEERLTVLLGDRELQMPPTLEPAVRRLAAAWSGVQVGGLADLMDEPSRLVLVRRLVREGLLEIAPSHGGA